MSEHQEQYDMRWLHRSALLLSKEYLPLTEEERQSIMEEIGVKEDKLADIFIKIYFFYERYNLASTDEEKESIIDEMWNFLGEVNNFKKEVDKKKKKSAAPAA